MSPAVEVDRLTKKFGAFTAVDGISFVIKAGTIFGFLGANGAGKSTTIRMLCGLLRPTSGRARVAGLDIARDADRIRKVIGYMSQRFSLYLDLKVEENLEFFGRVYGLDGEKLNTSLSRLKKLTGLEGLENIITAKLPTGWRQRLALSCALLHDPKIIFLDEPTGGVDPLTRRKFWDMIYEQADRGRTVLVTTHYLDEAEYCHELRIIHAGRIIAAGSPQEIKKKYFPENLLELTCRQPLQVYEWLKQQHEIKQVSLFGLKMHLLLEPDAVAGLEQKLAQSGLGQFALRPIVPGLEDVFIRRLEEEAGENRK